MHKLLGKKPRNYLLIAYHFKFYCATDESIKDFRDVILIILARQHKIVGSWSNGMTIVELMAEIAVGGHGIHCFYFTE